MSLVSSLKNLLIPRKSSSDTVDLDTDWRAIEIWSKQVVAAIKSITPGGFYASLTGPGETIPTGSLTQTGGFTVNDNTMTGIQLLTNGGGVAIKDTGGGGMVIDSNGGLQMATAGSGIQVTDSSVFGISLSNNVVNGNVDISVGPGAATGISMQSSAGGGMQIVTGSAQTLGISLQANGNNPITLEAAGTGTITLFTSHGHIKIGASPTADNVGFFGSSGSTQQSSAGVTTVAQIVTILQNYGLLS